MLFTLGLPGYTRGLTASGAGEFTVTTSNGQVARYWPARGESEVIAEGFDQLYGVAAARAAMCCSPNRAPAGCCRPAPGESRCWRPAWTPRSGSPSHPTVRPWSPRRVRAAWSHSAGRNRNRWSTNCVVRTASACSTDGSTSSPTPRTRRLSRSTSKPAAAGSSRPAYRSVRRPGSPKPLLGMPPFRTAGPVHRVTAGADGTIFVSADAEGSVLAIRRRD